MQDENDIFTDSPSDFERQQLLKMEKLRRLVQMLMLRYVWIFAAMFFALLVLLAVAVYSRGEKSPERYCAELELFYQPKSSDYFKPIDDHAMLQLFSRNVVRARTAETLAKSGFPHSDVSNAEIYQERNKNRLFKISAYGNTETEAVKKANAFAEVCVAEYKKFRLGDLENWLKTIRNQHDTLEQKIRETAEREVEISRKIGLTDPVAEQEKLRELLSEQKLSLSNLAARKAGIQSRVERLQKLFSALSPAALAHAGQIREYLDTIKQIDKSLLAETQLYTEDNPKIQVLRARKTATEKAYRQFLSDNSIENFKPDNLALAEKVKAELEEVIEEFETVSTNESLLRAEVSRNEKSVAKLAEVLPELTQLAHVQEAHKKNLENSEQRFTDLNYLKNSADNELQPLELAAAAERKKTFDKKKIAIILFLALAFTGTAAAALLVFKFMRGRIGNFAELDCYYGLLPLGVVPKNARTDTDIFDLRHAICEIFYKLHEAYPNAKRIFVGHLQGADSDNAIREAVHLQYASNGKRLMFVQIVSAHGLVEPQNATQLNSVCYCGNDGFLPVANEYSLSGAELNLFKADLQTLERDFDVIIITRKTPLGKRGILFRQMFDLCDTSMLLVGAGKTPRRMLRYALSLGKSDSPLTAVMIKNCSSEKNQRQ